MEDDIDFYCSETMVDLKKAGGVADEIDEGFFDKPSKLGCQQALVTL